MEDHVTFDLWGIAERAMQRELEEILRASQPEVKRASITRKIARSALLAESVILVENVGWRDVQVWRTRTAKFARSVRINQAGCVPTDERPLAFCSVHDLYFGGCLGCPVCSGGNAP